MKRSEQSNRLEKKTTCDENWASSPEIIQFPNESLDLFIHVFFLYKVIFRLFSVTSLEIFCNDKLNNSNHKVEK